MAAPPYRARAPDQLRRTHQSDTDCLRFEYVISTRGAGVCAVDLQYCVCLQVLVTRRNLAWGISAGEGRLRCRIGLFDATFGTSTGEAVSVCKLSSTSPDSTSPSSVGWLPDKMRSGNTSCGHLDVTTRRCHKLRRVLTRTRDGGPASDLGVPVISEAIAGQWIGYSGCWSSGIPKPPGLESVRHLIICPDQVEGTSRSAALP
jgi:hypothetical protein